MTTQMTEEMRQAVAHGEMVYLEDPQTKASYVLLSKSDYDRLRSLMGIDQMSIPETYALQNSVAHAQGWDDPLMDEYDHYDQHKKTA